MPGGDPQCLAVQVHHLDLHAADKLGTHLQFIIRSIWQWDTRSRAVTLSGAHATNWLARLDNIGSRGVGKPRVALVAERLRRLSPVAGTRGKPLSPVAPPRTVLRLC